MACGRRIFIKTVAIKIFAVTAMAKPKTTSNRVSIAFCAPDHSSVTNRECVQGIPGFRVGSASDLACVLTDPAVHAVNLGASTPASIVIECLQAGKHVWLEPPVIATSKEAASISQAATAAGRVLTIGAIHRSAPHWQVTRRLIASGALGPIAFCRVSGPRLDEFVDAVPFALGDPVPQVVAVQPGHSTITYPGFVLACHCGPSNESSAASFHGERATLVVNCDGAFLHTRDDGTKQLARAEPDLAIRAAHWTTFLNRIEGRSSVMPEIVSAARSAKLYRDITS